jgi:murein DD-endopeptidase MepM/ murein hydrolase activator NlpD
LLCSPLGGFTLKQLPNLISNKFSPPPLGSDDPHQGIDFSIVDPDAGYATGGNPIQAVLNGVVATIIENRFPYGNAIIIETPMDSLPESWLHANKLPTPAPTLNNHPILTCPKVDYSDFSIYSYPVEQADRSIYLMYAHLAGPIELNPGDPVHCGQKIDAMGESGNALNPHLHLEIRVGPTMARFHSLAHYDASASPEEMANYCTWRVSGLFQLINPMDLLSVPP